MQQCAVTVAPPHAAVWKWRSGTAIHGRVVKIDVRKRLPFVVAHDPSVSSANQGEGKRRGWSHWFFGIVCRA
jgi:hypothetical protein